MRAPTLIIGYGNPSRGDDALGPLALERIAQHIEQCNEQRNAGPAEAGQIELLTDFQLQIELVTDMAQRERVIFIDADVSLTQPFCFTPLQEPPASVGTSHALEPASLLAVYRNFYACAAPPAFLLVIRGYEFELGTALSAAARTNLDAALAMLEDWLARHCAREACHA